jgi:hypothetical protein
MRSRVVLGASASSLLPAVQGVRGTASRRGSEGLGRTAGEDLLELQGRAGNRAVAKLVAGSERRGGLSRISASCLLQRQSHPASHGDASAADVGRADGGRADAGSAGAGRDAGSADAATASGSLTAGDGGRITIRFVAGAVPEPTVEPVCDLRARARGQGNQFVDDLVAFTEVQPRFDASGHGSAVTVTVRLNFPHMWIASELLPESSPAFQATLRHERGHPAEWLTTMPGNVHSLVTDLNSEDYMGHHLGIPGIMRIFNASNLQIGLVLRQNADTFDSLDYPRNLHPAFRAAGVNIPSGTSHCGQAPPSQQHAVAAHHR